MEKIHAEPKTGRNIGFELLLAGLVLGTTIGIASIRGHHQDIEPSNPSETPSDVPEFNSIVSE